MEEITVTFYDMKELYRCYMSYMKYGGLFVPSAQQYKMGQELILKVILPDTQEPVSVNGRVVWLAPAGLQGNTPAGMGVAFTDNKTSLNSRIEKLLGGLLNSSEPTYTM